MFLVYQSVFTFSDFSFSVLLHLQVDLKILAYTLDSKILYEQKLIKLDIDSSRLNFWKLYFKS